MTNLVAAGTETILLLHLGLVTHGDVIDIKSLFSNKSEMTFVL